MFVSEKAALKFCTEEYKKLKSRRQSKWEDKDFGPTSKTDAKGSARALYPNGDESKIPVGYVKPEDVEWVWS